MAHTLKKMTPSIIDDISVTKSDSKVCGLKLREAHERLGAELAKEMCLQEFHRGEKVDIIILMRSGLSFGLGVAKSIELMGHATRIFFDKLPNDSDNELWKNPVVIVDSVINSGDSILKLLKTTTERRFIVLANVISSISLEKFSDFSTYVVRISENYFVGSHVKTVDGGLGPDTGDRLFYSEYYEE